MRAITKLLSKDSMKTKLASTKKILKIAYKNSNVSDIIAN